VIGCVNYDVFPARELLPNPHNWRRHPHKQATALHGILAEIGFADAVLARETPDGLMLIDGHLRAEMMHGQDLARADSRCHGGGG
jgi:hypothetical protein